MSDPIKQFRQWLDQASTHKDITEPTAFCLATTDGKGQPSARIVLLKTIDNGFVFYTNMQSRKSRELRHNPKAAACFYWMPLMRQVRIEGVIEQVSSGEADEYFATRARESQIGAWASKQSSPLKNREELMKAVRDNKKKFEGQPVPRPEFWSGWRLIPETIEFWEASAYRLHDREVFTRKGNRWDVTRLYP